MDGARYLYPIASPAEDTKALRQVPCLARGLDRCAILVRPAFELAVGAAVLLFAYAYLVPMFDYLTQLVGR